MKKSNLIEARRQKVNPEIRHMVDLSFKIVDRIHKILKAKGLKQKVLARRLGTMPGITVLYQILLREFGIRKDL